MKRVPHPCRAFCDRVGILTSLPTHAATYGFFFAGKYFFSTDATTT